MQNRVSEFNKSRTCHKREVPTFARIMNIQSEVGELAKSYLEATKYGTLEFVVTDNFKEELGDVLYAVLSLACETQLDASLCLDDTLSKLKKRMDKNGSMKGN